MDGVMDKPDENVRRGRAMQAHYLLDLLTRGCRLPKGIGRSPASGGVAVAV
jgi:hypothetical protein